MELMQTHVHTQAFDASDSISGLLGVGVQGEIKPEDLVRVSRPITDATLKTVAAGQSCLQDDVIVAANQGRKAISDMLYVCKVGLFSLHTIFHIFLKVYTITLNKILSE